MELLILLIVLAVAGGAFLAGRHSLAPQPGQSDAPEPSQAILEQVEALERARAEAIAEIAAAEARLEQLADEYVQSQRSANSKPATLSEQALGAIVSPERALANSRAWRRRTYDQEQQLIYWEKPSGDLSTDGELRQALAAAGANAQVCFTGWSYDERDHLENLALRAKIRVMTGVAKRLTILCVGQTPGDVKLAEAKKRGAVVISGAQFDRIARERFEAEK